MSRTTELMRTTPFGVLFISGICAMTFLLQNIYPASPLGVSFEYNFTMSPRAVIFQHQYYRIITSSFLHGSMFHIAANMMTFSTLGSFLERSFGTLWHLSTIFYSVLLVSCMEILIAYSMYKMSVSEGLMNGHSLGFSGTLFHLLVIQVRSHNTTSTHSVFGLFQVTPRLYPWASLVVVQFILPNVSFVGHLSGILCGELHTAGYLNCILPCAQRLRLLDESPTLSRCRISLLENYVKTPFSDDVFNNSFSGRDRDSSSLSSRTMAVSQFLSMGCNFVKDKLQSLKVAIFGRGDVNDNIRLSEDEISTLLVGIGNNTDAEGEWNGLETVPLSDNESENV